MSLVHLRFRQSACAPSADSAIRETIAGRAASARVPRIAVLFVASALAAGCSPDSDATEGTAPVVQLGGPGETNRVLTSSEIDELAGTGYTDADADFVHGMIAHHEQALAMTALVEARAGREDLGLLAERMDVSQRDEIAQLESWLTDRGEDVTLDDGAHVAHGTLMPGMLTAEELAQLEGARGHQFDRLFLQYMIRHHEGAVAMVEQLLTEGRGGQEPQIFQLAQHIEIDQQVEIARMKQVLTELPPAD